MTPRRRVGILISGRGSNMMALAAAARAPDYPAEIVCVVSNRPMAAGLAWAREQGLPAYAIDHKAYATREAFEDALHAVLEAERVQLVACAGFYAAQYLNARKLPSEGLKVTVTAAKAQQPARLDSFRIDVHTPELDPRHEEGVLRAVKSCLIHNTMHANPAIEIAVRASAPAI